MPHLIAQLATVYEPHTGRLFPCLETSGDPEHLPACPAFPVAGPFRDAEAARAWARQVLGARDFRVVHSA